ncbi:MAG: MotA/TolQ/ExbB proton channel family protein [Burkholderiales bacterium]|nr:MotA/TolQ/ExbB proton channel family protein [Burkholderiales bacterium]
MEPTQSLGFAHFLAQADALARGLLVVLLAMSLATWYLIATKGIERWIEQRRSRRFLAPFWASGTLAQVQSCLEGTRGDEPFARLARHAMLAHRKGDGEFLTRAMRRVIEEDTARMESGLTVLASVGSTAPFVGLFGTVWAIYHALTAIGISGQGTLDKVAGPVGEALIMTAIGLAVAIPAVLAYNGFVRSNRLVLARLDAFAHDLYALLTTGSQVGAVVPLKQAAAG